MLLKNVGLLSDVLTVFVRAVYALQRRRARRQGIRRAQAGADRVLRLLEKRGTLPAQGPEDAQQVYQAHSLQQRLR